MADVESSTSKALDVESYRDLETPHVDIHGVAIQIAMASKSYREHAGSEVPPTRSELVTWYVYGLCSHFVHAFLIPVLFPLIIAHINSPADSDFEQSMAATAVGMAACSPQITAMHQKLIHRSISIAGAHFSALHWTAISWAAGIIVACPVLAHAACYLDHGHHQPLILSGATAIGAVFCLLTGFFRTPWVFPLYIAAIATASATGAAAHSRHLGLMVRGITAHATGKDHFERRRAVSGWLSSHATGAGSAGAALIAAFTYHMLRRSDHRTSLWVVSIFSGLAWLAGVSAAPANPRSPISPDAVSTLAHVFTIRNYPHAAGSLVGAFLSSLASMCIFTGGTIYIIGGEVCIRPVIFLSLWMLYFGIPTVTLPALHPIQLALRADAVQMQLLGFFLSTGAAGTGFYFKDRRWQEGHVAGLAVLLSVGAGLSHAFGRVLLLDCAPAGKEGAFSAWLEWVRAVGACTGFAVAVAYPGDVPVTFGVSFSTAFVGVLVLVFGNISNYGGAVAAGHARVVVEGREEGSPVDGKDRVGEGMSPSMLLPPYPSLAEERECLSIQFRREDL